MKRKSWKSTLGGALGALGKTLMGVGIVPQLAGVPNTTLSWIATVGFFLDAAGGFFAHLFSADTSMVIDAIEKAGGDTSMLVKQPDK
jgi:hypothetical protein